MKSMVEKSPNALRVFTLARRSCISGTEKVEFSSRMPGRSAGYRQPVLVAVDQRLEQDSAHQRENGSVRADAERQCENHGDRQPWSPNERVSRNSQIANE